MLKEEDEKEKILDEKIATIARESAAKEHNMVCYFFIFVNFIKNDS